jgi:hypothetical protein
MKRFKKFQGLKVSVFQNNQRVTLFGRIERKEREKIN